MEKPAKSGEWMARATLVVILVAIGAAGAYQPLPVLVALCAPIAVVVALRQLKPVAIGALVILCLCELHIDFGGRTIRAETILILLIGVGVIWPAVTGQRRLSASHIYRPLLVFIGILCWSILVGMHQPVSAEAKLIAAVNGVRIILAYFVFVVVYNFRAGPEEKLRAVINAAVLFTFVSCGIALLQIAHHKGVLPFGLPALLTEHKPGANVEYGREIFGPVSGQTGAHTFASMLSLQALTVFSVALVIRSKAKKILLFGFFVVIGLILVRISVRVALLSLFGACCTVVVLTGRNTWRKLVIGTVVGTCAFSILHYFVATVFQSYWLERIRLAIPVISAKGIEWPLGTTMFERFSYWNTAWMLAVRHPLLGIGFNMYGPVAGPILATGPNITHPHNGFLHVFVELGLIGTMVFAWLAVAIVKEILKVRKEYATNTFERAADVVLPAILVWLAVANIPASTFLFPKETIFFMALLGARLAVAHGSGSDDQCTERAASDGQLSSADKNLPHEVTS